MQIFEVKTTLLFTFIIILVTTQSKGNDESTARFGFLEYTTDDYEQICKKFCRDSDYLFNRHPKTLILHCLFNCHLLLSPSTSSTTVKTTTFSSIPSPVSTPNPVSTTQRASNMIPNLQLHDVLQTKPLASEALDDNTTVPNTTLSP